MEKIIIFGGKGMLGSDLTHVLENQYEVLSLGHRDGDITDNDLVQKLVLEEKPHIIINCAAMTAVDLAESEPEQAFLSNAKAVENIASAAKTTGAKVFHFSTDYVFHGDRQEGYTEDDPKNPINVYGKSKSQGEDVLLEQYPEGSFIIRTAWLYGAHGKNFVSTMLDLAGRNDTLKVVEDQIGSPTYTHDIAQTVQSMLKEKVSPSIYHVVNNGRTNWYEFAKKIFEFKKIGVEVQPVTSDEFPRPAKRPMYSVLRNTKLPPLRSWQEALKEFLERV